MLIFLLSLGRLRMSIKMINNLNYAQHYSVFHKNELKLDEDKVRLHVEDMAQSYENPAQVVEWYYKDKNRLKDVIQMTMEEQVTGWLLENATITTENVDFNTVMNA